MMDKYVEKGARGFFLGLGGYLLAYRLSRAFIVEFEEDVEIRLRKLANEYVRDYPEKENELPKFRLVR